MAVSGFNGAILEQLTDEMLADGEAAEETE
jgi:hypothetical protein